MCFVAKHTPQNVHIEETNISTSLLNRLICGQNELSYKSQYHEQRSFLSMNSSPNECTS